MNMTGRFPEAVQHFSFLQHLNLGMGFLHGPLPANLCSTLSHLQHLELRDNELSGTIPPEWYTSAVADAADNVTTSGCRHLEFLDLSRNQLRGALSPPQVDGSVVDVDLHEWKATSKLRELHLHGNAFTGTIPVNLWAALAAGDATDLLFHDNRFEGSIPDAALSNLSSLHQLRLDQNRFTGTISAAHLAPSLVHLNLADNPWTPGALPATLLYNLTNLMVLNMTNTHRTGSLRGVGWDDADNDALFLWTALEFLFLDRNRLTGTIPTWLHQLPNLQRLSLKDNDWLQPVPAEFCQSRTLLASRSSSTGSTTFDDPIVECPNGTTTATETTTSVGNASTDYYCCRLR